MLGSHYITNLVKEFSGWHKVPDNNHIETYRLLINVHRYYKIDMRETLALYCFQASNSRLAYRQTSVIHSLYNVMLM